MSPALPDGWVAPSVGVPPEPRLALTPRPAPARLPRHALRPEPALEHAVDIVDIIDIVDIVDMLPTSRRTHRASCAFSASEPGPDTVLSVSRDTE